MRLAVVDLGTNTCRLLLAEAEDGRIVRMDARETNVVRLGEGVDANRRLLPEAAARTRRRLDDYGRRIREYRPEASLLLATSVLRDAADGRAFLEEAARAAGLTPRLIDGATEARLAFRGATSRLDLPSGRVAVADIGGGSTELSVGDAGDGGSTEPSVGGAGDSGSTELSVGDVGGSTESSAADVGGGTSPSFVVSVDIGVVRLTERYFADDPPTEPQWREAASAIDSALGDAVPPGRRGVAALVGVAGTFTTLSANVLGLREYDPWRVHGSRLTRDQIRAAILRFRALTSAERGLLPGIQEGREDVILAGALLAERICELFGAVEVIVSEADILDGAALWLADGLPDLA